MKAGELTPEERVVLDCRGMQLKEKEALLNCDAQGFPMKKSKYYEVVLAIRKKTMPRLKHIQSIGLAQKGLDRIDQFNLIVHEQWSRYKSAVENDQQGVASMILDRLAIMQTYLAIAESDIAIILEKQTELELQLAMKEKSERDKKK